MCWNLLLPSVSFVYPTQMKLTKMHYHVLKFSFLGMGFLPVFEILHKHLDFCLQYNDGFLYVDTPPFINQKYFNLCYALMIFFSGKTEV